MPTVLTKTIGGGSSPTRDYGSLSAFEADLTNIGTSSDLVTNDEQIVGEIYKNSDTSSLSLTGKINWNATMTTDATRNIVLTVVEADRHSGQRNTGIRVDPGGAGHCFQIGIDHLRFEYLEVESGTNTSDECFRISDGIVGLQILKCILETGDATKSDQDGVYCGNSSIGSSSDPILIRDCLIQGFERGGIHAQQFSGGAETTYWQIVNCTFADNDGGVLYDYDNASTVHNFEVVNCLGINNVTKDFGLSSAGSGSISTTGSANNHGEYSGSSFDFPSNTQITGTDNTSPGAGTWAIVADLTGVDYTVWDLLLVDDADNDVQGAGVGPSSNSLVDDTDAIGNSRSGTTCDVGFHEVTAGASPTDYEYLRRYENSPAPNPLLRM